MSSLIDLKDADTLWRRCREMESKENFAEAFKMALHLQRMDPKNEEILSTLRRLNIRVQKAAEEQNSTENRVKTMLKYLKEGESLGLDVEKRVAAANNLIALVRDDAGRKCFIDQKGFDVMMALMRDAKVKYEIRLALIRCLTELASGSEELGRLILKNVGVNYLVELMSRIKEDELLTASQTVIQSLLTRFSGFSAKDSTVKVDQERLKKNEVELDAIMSAVLDRINSRTMTAECRDSLLELLMVNTDYQALNWGRKLLEFDGLFKLLEVASELQEIRYESSMDITANTRTHVGLTLEKVYMCMDSDKSREVFHNKMMDYLNALLKGADIESKVRATAAITALLNGPIDAGNFCLGQAGIVEMMLVMANSGDIAQQCVAAEAIIAAASKKDKGKTMAQMGTSILKALYKSSNPKIKVRALVGLCKLGSVGGTDASAKVFSEESTMKLMKACCNLLTTEENGQSEEDVKKWAADGLAYLTLDADVKEALIEDKKSLASLVELGKVGSLSVLFGVVTTFVNLTNSYEKQEIMPEMVELAKFAKHHVPEEHELDAVDFILKRCKLLAEAHVTTALVSLTRSQSKTSREMICRVFNALCEIKELRGQVVQEGGVKALIQLALNNNTDLGKKLAAQALARIAITNNPDLVFPGQRSVEVVGPIMELLHPDCAGLQNFEALMALTNLAQHSASVRNRILKNSGFRQIEHYLYEDHDMIKRAAVQCITNLILMEQVVKMFESPQSEQVKYLVMMLFEEDLDTVSAAAGALAMLTSVSKKSCEKIFTAKDWLQALIQLVSSKNPDLTHRGVVIVYNLIAAGGECAQTTVESPLLELLMALVRPEVDDVDEQVKKIAAEALKVAEEQKLIKNIEKLQVESS